MTTAHETSDNTAIAAAHDRRAEIAAERLRKLVGILLAHPTSPWVVDALCGAAKDVHRQGIADMEARLRAASGSPERDQAPAGTSVGSEARPSFSNVPIAYPECRWGSGQTKPPRTDDRGEL